MITPSFSLTATERVLPKLALDFTTASLDSRITFTRTTGASNPATYVNSSGLVTAATDNQPRFDYDPVTLACKGLLIEESRSNVIISSADFSTSWTSLYVSLTTDQTTAPDGTNTADKQVPNTELRTHETYQNGKTYIAGQAYTVSVYAKPAGYNFLNLSFYDGVSNNCWFNISTGVVGTAAAGCTLAIQPAGNGWYRCSVTKTSAGTTNGGMSLRSVNANNVSSFTGNGTSGMYIWGAQIEAGAFATSYIPTTTTALTRNADVATMTGTNFSSWFNASEGTFVVSGQKGGSTFTPFYTAHDGTNNNKIESDFDAAAHLVVVNGGVTQANVDAGTVSANTFTKVAAAYKENSFAACISGGSVATDTSGTIPTVNRLQIGGAFNAIPYGTKTIAALSYYPMRLTNAEVQAFSK